jgi:hypothetical protein
MKIISIINEEISGILSEGLSKILYHFTHTNNLLNMLKTNKFATSSNLGSRADSWKDRGRFFFFSTQRAKGTSGYGSHHGNVSIVLDGQKLNQKYKGFPTDYWNWSMKRSDYPNINDYVQAMRSKELEDRIVTNEPYIEDAKSYILEIHIWIRNIQNKQTGEEVLQYADNIPVYFYTDEKNYKLQNKAKAVPLDQIKFPEEPEEEPSEYYSSENIKERKIRDITSIFERIAPMIIYNQTLNNEFNENRNAVYELAGRFAQEYGNPEILDRVMYKIDEVLRGYYYNGINYADDYYRVLASDIHNHRGNPNEYFRELLRMLIADMKKWGTKDVHDYVYEKLSKRK